MKQEVLGYKIPTFSEGMIIANQAQEKAGEIIKQFIKDDPRWVPILGYAMNPKFKMNLPEGDPPYKVSEFPEGISDTSLLELHRSMGAFYNHNARKSQVEELFIRHLEGMTPDDAKHLLAIKDKKLHTLYEYITEDVLLDVLGWDRLEYEKLK